MPQLSSRLHLHSASSRLRMAVGRKGAAGLLGPAVRPCLLLMLAPLRQCNPALLPPPHKNPRRSLLACLSLTLF